MPRRKVEVAKAKALVKKSTGTSRPSKYIGSGSPDKPASKTYKNPAKPKTPVKRSTTGRTGRVGRGGAGGAFLENLK